MMFWGSDDGKGMKDMQEVENRGRRQMPGQLVQQHSLHPQQFPLRAPHPTLVDDLFCRCYVLKPRNINEILTAMLLFFKLENICQKNFHVVFTNVDMWLLYWDVHNGE